MIKTPLFLLVFRGVASDLTKVDFSFAGYRFVSLDSPEVDEYLRTADPEFDCNNPEQYLARIRKEHQWKCDPYYVVLADSFLDASYNKAMRCFILLSVIYPSHFQLLHEIQFIRPEERLHQVQMTTHDTLGYDHVLQIEDDNLPELNEFIKLVYDRIAGNGYITYVIDLYLQSQQASLRYHRYLSLAMAVETLLLGTSEIIYRLKRTVAILLGATPEEGYRMFSLMNDIYTLRSQIVHGETFDREKVKHYLPALQAIVSRLIIELLVHNIHDKTALDKAITSIGFGDRDKLSVDYQEYVLNHKTFNLAIIDFPKYIQPAKGSR